MAQTLADRVRARRELFGWSKKTLAENAGLHPSHVTLIEGAARTEMRPSTISKLAAALGVTEEWLLHGTDDPKAPVEDAYLPVVLLAKRHHVSPVVLQKLVEALIVNSLEQTGGNERGGSCTGSGS